MNGYGTELSEGEHYMMFYHWTDDLGIIQVRSDIMDNQIDPKIMDNITKICICRAIPRSKIKDAIRKGADSVVKVNEVTGSGSGECRGRRCGLKIKGLIDGYRNGEWE